MSSQIRSGKRSFRHDWPMVGRNLQLDWLHPNSTQIFELRRLKTTREQGAVRVRPVRGRRSSWRVCRQSQ